MGSGFSYRVLVVDDEPTVLQVSRLVFSEHGYEVRTAADGFEALVELRRSMPDVIISDLRMPNMSGFELLSVVRRRFPSYSGRRHLWRVQSRISGGANCRRVFHEGAIRA